MTRWWRRGPDRGAAAVEFALVLPQWLTVVFGIIDFGRMMNTQERLTAAARAGAQGALLTGDPTAGAQAVFPGVSAIVVRSCPDPPGPTDTLAVQVVPSPAFQFVTPIAVLAGITGTPALSATGAVPCRG